MENEAWNWTNAFGVSDEKRISVRKMGKNDEKDDDETQNKRKRNKKY